MKSFSDTATIPVSDLLQLASDKEHVGDLSGAINYTEKALEAAPAIEADFKQQLRTKLQNLRARLMKSDAMTSATPRP